MALIKCPECGRENVSDSAEMCPACGFGVKNYFEKIKRKEEYSQYLRKKELEQNRVNLEEKKRNEMRMERVTLPKLSGTIYIVLLLGIPGFFLALSELKTDSDMIQDSIDRGNGNPKVTGMILLIAALSFIGIGIFGLINHIIEYNLAKKDFETYKKHVIELEDIAINNAKFDMEVNLIKCPNCGSKNTKKISTTSRVTSVAMLGVASGKIGKQYECKQCKYKW